MWFSFYGIVDCYSQNGWKMTLTISQVSFGGLAKANDIETSRLVVEEATGPLKCLN